MGKNKKWLGEKEDILNYGTIYCINTFCELFFKKFIA
jgi:hypothetical protein